MQGYCHVLLLGNLTRKPEVRFTPGGMAICKFGLAVNRKYKAQDGTWKEEATFVDVTIFGKRGEAFAKFHDKGKGAFIEGELRLDQWEDKQTGEKRQKLYVVGNEWRFVGGNPPSQGQSHASQDDWDNAKPAGEATPAGAKQGDYTTIDDIDDTPF